MEWEVEVLLFRFGDNKTSQWYASIDCSLRCLKPLLIAYSNTNSYCISVVVAQFSPSGLPMVTHHTCDFVWPISTMYRELQTPGAGKSRKRLFSKDTVVTALTE
jgi:hypothetical protein